MRSRRFLTVLAALGAGTVLSSLVVSCSSDGTPVDGLGYVVDGAVPTYNVSSDAGAASAARQAFVRVQTGFSYPGPHGETVYDRDFGTVAPVAGDPSSIEYRINPAAVYSDGAPVVCDDMVLAWAAESGRFSVPGADGGQVPLFDAPVDPVMAQIESIDCDPGGKEAVVHYGGDGAVSGWRSAFGATSMLPSHVVAQGAAGIDPGGPGKGGEDDGQDDAGSESAEPAPAPAGVDIVSAVQDEDIDALKSVAHYWNTAFELTPGTVDTDVFVSSGPYRLEKVREDGSLELVVNDAWWGDRARTDRIVVHPRTASVNTLADDGEVDALSVGAGSVEGLAVPDGFRTAVTATDDVEQLVFSTTGTLASVAARAAVAACVPRGQIAAAAPGSAEQDAAQAPVQDSRSVLPGTTGYGFVSETAAGGYVDPDLDAAKSALAEAGVDGLTVRVGYRAPDARRAGVVSAMAKACAPAGIQIHDSGSADFTPQSLEDGSVDAVLGGTGGTQAGPPRGPDTAVARLTALTTGATGNIGGYSNPRVDEIVDALRMAPRGGDALTMLREAEQILWDDLPTLPLYRTPRQASFAQGLHGGDPTTSWAGAGWNMDRWMVLK